MRVTPNSTTEQFILRLQTLNEKLLKSSNEVSSGQKLNTPSDDPTAVGRVFSMQSDQRKLNQYLSNIERAEEVSTVTYSHIDSIKDLVIRAEELATGVDDLTDPSEFAATALEVNQLLEQAVQSGNAQHRGQYIFSGDATDTEPYTVTRDLNGNITGIAFSGSNNVSSFEVSEGMTLSPYSSDPQNQQLLTIMNNLMALRDGLNASDTTAVTAARISLADDEDVIINQISAHAAIQSRLELAKTQIEKSSTAVENRVSSEADADIAEATVRYNSLYNSYQAAIAAGSKMLSTSLLDYL